MCAMPDFIAPQRTRESLTSGFHTVCLSLGICSFHDLSPSHLRSCLVTIRSYFLHNPIIAMVCRAPLCKLSKNKCDTRGGSEGAYNRDRFSRSIKCVSGIATSGDFPHYRRILAVACRISGCTFKACRCRRRATGKPLGYRQRHRNKTGKVAPPDAGSCCAWVLPGFGERDLHPESDVGDTA